MADPQLISVESITRTGDGWAVAFAIEITDGEAIFTVLVDADARIEDVATEAKLKLHAQLRMLVQETHRWVHPD